MDLTNIEFVWTVTLDQFLTALVLGYGLGVSVGITAAIVTLKRRGAL